MWGNLFCFWSVLISLQFCFVSKEHSFPRVALFRCDPRGLLSSPGAICGQFASNIVSLPQIKVNFKISQYLDMGHSHSWTVGIVDIHEELIWCLDLSKREDTYSPNLQPCQLKIFLARRRCLSSESDDRQTTKEGRSDYKMTLQICSLPFLLVLLPAVLLSRKVAVSFRPLPPPSSSAEAFANINLRCCYGQYLRRA